MNEFKWHLAGIKLEKAEKIYKELGSRGKYILVFKVCPLTKRYRDGERSADLFKKIVEL